MRWTLGGSMALFLALVLVINIPVVQSWIADGVSQVLETKLDTEVSIKRVQVGINGRIIIDGLAVKDRNKKEMLNVARAGVRINVWDLLFKKEIKIGNAQLYGMKGRFYQDRPGTPANFQFLIDAFKSKDTTSTTPINLRIGQFVIRRADIKWDKNWEPYTPGHINPNHIKLSNLNLTAQLNILTNDSLNLEFKRLDAREQSGIKIQNLFFNVVANRRETHVSDFRIELPGSYIDIPKLVCHTQERKINDLALNIDGKIASEDITAILPLPSNIPNTLNINMFVEGNPDLLQISSLALNDGDGALNLKASGSVYNLTKGAKQIAADLNIQRLNADGRKLGKYLSSPLLGEIGVVEVQGPLSWGNGEASGDIYISTQQGDIQLTGTGNEKGEIDLCAYSERFKVSSLLTDGAKQKLGDVALDLQVTGNIKDELKVSGSIPLLEFQKYPYRNIEIDGTYSQENRYEGSLAIHDANIAFNASGLIDLKNRIIECKADVERIMPNTLNLTTRYPDTQFSGKLDVSLQGSPWDNMEGRVYLDDINMLTPDGEYKPGNIHITSKPEGNERHILLISPFLEAQVDGEFTPQSITKYALQQLNAYFPTLTPSVEKESYHNVNGTVIAKIYNAEPLQKFAGVPLTIDQPAEVKGEINSNTQELKLAVNAPSIKYSNETIRDLDIHIKSEEKSLHSTINLQRLMKGKFVNMGVEASNIGDKLITRLYWNNQRQPVIAGDVNIVSHLYKDYEGRQAIKGEIIPSNIIIGDSLWNVFPGAFDYQNGVLKIDSLGLGSGNHYLTIDGRASKEDSDTLHAKLHKIKLEYIFSLINFHAVELVGDATGNVYARNLFSKPYLDAFLQIPQFSLNKGILGDLNIYGNWGMKDYSIFLDGVINDPQNNSRSLVKGFITPKKDVAYHGIDLNIQAERVNMYFLNKYTHAIFDDLEGRATGWARIFGPFKKLNLEGDVVVDEGSLGIPYLGVRYHMSNDSVTLRPGNIYFSNADIFDPLGTPEKSGHRGKVNGHLRHEHFSNLSYDISIDAENILGYDFKDFGDLSFYGTVLATGNVGLSGSPGKVDIDVKATPQPGTSITYNATSPEKITQNNFITYIDRNVHADTTEIKTQEIEDSPSSDIRINFDLDIDKNSSMNLLMDARAGDMIKLNGRGHILARYYNKGNFQLFGTYRIEKGTYGLSLQEIIQKNFDIQEGGAIVFSGDPYDADLNIQAIHTVSGVSLNDISARATFSNTSARVNCLMNVSGKARQPHITFDFDIPNVNEEEKQMVRSLISTEEERNMQVVYLLGIGRFYTYDYTNDNQSQSYTAMNSLLSSTLSGQINQMLTNMIGNTDWNFGANLSTGETGWSDMDVEGMLQGSLLNNRLLLNGNFGYRDNPMSSTNFIGDFDAQYHLTRSGSVSLKAYSETNDRYFTKSSLTTQGIGFLLKKDFSSLRDLFSKKKNKYKHKD